MRPELVEHRAVLVLVGDSSDVREVLRGGAQHRRPADIDHLDDLGLGHAAPVRKRRERIEVDADHVERLDPLLGDRRDVLRQLAPREDPGVDTRVERLDAAAQHLRRLGDVFDTRHGQALHLEEGGGATGGDQFEAQFVQAARERVDPFFS